MPRTEWDLRKDAANQRKHGVSFAAASSVLDDPFALLSFDRTVEGEDRWRLVGRSAGGGVLVLAASIVQSGEAEVVRIISARRALRQERLNYENQAY